MKKILSLMFMLVVAACMTGCSLHGGHGHGPAATTTTEMTLRTSIPASVFDEGGEANLKAALRAADAEKCTVNFGGIILEHEKYDATNKLHFFAKLVQKTVVQAMAKLEEKTKIKIQKESGEQVGKIVEVDLPADFAEASDEQKSEPQTAAVVIKADGNGEITGAKTLSIVQLVEVAKKNIEELVEAFVAVEEKANTFAEVVVKKDERDEGKTITKEEAEEKNPVKKDDPTPATETTFSVKFYQASNILWNYNVDKSNPAWEEYVKQCESKNPPVTPTEAGFILEYLKSSAEHMYETASGILNPSEVVFGSEVKPAMTISLNDMQPVFDEEGSGKAYYKAIVVKTYVDGKEQPLFDGDDEKPNGKPTCEYTSLKGTVALVKTDGTKVEMTVNSFEDVMEPKQGQDKDVVHKNGIDIVTANGAWYVKFKRFATPGKYQFTITEATLRSKLTSSAADSDFKDYKLATVNGVVSKDNPFTFEITIDSFNQQQAQEMMSNQK